MGYTDLSQTPHFFDMLLLREWIAKFPSDPTHHTTPTRRYTSLLLVCLTGEVYGRTITRKNTARMVYRTHEMSASDEPSADSNKLVSEKQHPLIKSTHLIFFKIADYIDVEFQHMDKNFLLIFHNSECCFDFLLATLIFMSELFVMVNLFDESKGNCKDDGNQPKNIWMATLLCALYAANVGTIKFYQAFPYELVGTDPERVKTAYQEFNRRRRNTVETDEPSSDTSFTTSPIDCLDNSSLSDHPAQSLMKGAASSSSPLPDIESDSRYISSNPMSGLITHILHPKPSVDKFVKYSKSAVSYLYIYSVATLLQLNNLLLLLVIGSVLGTAQTFRELISSFISVELITNVHEIVPRALYLCDKSPTHFNKSRVQLEYELELAGILPIGQIKEPDENGKGGIHRYSSKVRKKLLFWIIFCFVYSLFLLTTKGCNWYRTVYN
jgi:hypothetical protein